MGIVFFFLTIFSLIFLNTEAVTTNCPSVNCSQEGPNIRFPFSVQGLQPQNCSYRGYKFLCRKNETIIQFPTYGDLVVKSISYDSKKLSLIDPKTCIHEVFLNLNLSDTPFKYYYVLKNYMYLNCSTPLSPTFVQVPCLSGSDYHVYVVEPTQEVPVSCRAVKTIGIPFSYSPYLSDNSFGLGLTWELFGHEDFEVKAACFKFWHVKVLGVIFIIFMAAILKGVKTYWPKVVWDYSSASVKGEMGKHFESVFGNGNYGNCFKEIHPDEICFCQIEKSEFDGKAPLK